MLSSIFIESLIILHWTVVEFCSCNTKVYRISFKDSKELSVLNNIHKNVEELELDIWQNARTFGEFSDIMVLPKSQLKFERLLDVTNTTFSIPIENLEKLIIEKEGDTITMNKNSSFHAETLADFVSSSKTSRLAQKYGIDFRNYQSYSQITAYMMNLEKRNPNFVKMHTLGYTEEDRPIYMLQVGIIDESSRDDKPSIWIDGGTHAREWLSITTALYLIKTLVDNYEGNDQIKKYVEKLHWYILPVVNPDGYEYTRTSKKPQVRLWRKNRSTNFDRCPQSRKDVGTCCKGVDLNRNYDFHWSKTGSSQDPCSLLYNGPAPFSEAETEAVKKFLLEKRLDGQNSIKAFITLHTYAQMWFYPYGHKRRHYPANVNKLKEASNKAVKAIKALYGTEFKSGTGADLLYEAAGSSNDWANDVAGIKYSFLLELRPKYASPNGFIVDKNQIEPTARETWEGVRTIADIVINEEEHVKF